MGWAAARKLRVTVTNYQRILGVELACASRAIDLRAPLAPSPVTTGVVALVREFCDGPGPDRWLAPELAAVADLVASGAIRAATESVIGSLDVDDVQAHIAAHNKGASS